MKNFWKKITAWWKGVSPELKRFLKAALKLGIDALLPVALSAVVQAEKKGGSGKEKFDFAYGYVKTQYPKALSGAIMTAVQNAWATKEAEGWK